MKFKMDVRFLGCKIGQIGEGANSSMYFTVTLYDEVSHTTFDTGFVANKNTYEMEDFLTSSNFGDVLSVTLILRKAEKDNRYKIGLVSVG